MSGGAAKGTKLQALDLARCGWQITAKVRRSANASPYGMVQAGTLAELQGETVSPETTHLELGRAVLAATRTRLEADGFAIIEGLTLVIAPDESGKLKQVTREAIEASGQPAREELMPVAIGGETPARDGYVNHLSHCATCKNGAGDLACEVGMAMMLAAKLEAGEWGSGVDLLRHTLDCPDCRADIAEGGDGCPRAVELLIAAARESEKGGAA